MEFSSDVGNVELGLEVNSITSKSIAYFNKYTNKQINRSKGQTKRILLLYLTKSDTWQTTTPEMGRSENTAKDFMSTDELSFKCSFKGSSLSKIGNTADAELPEF